MDDALTVVHVAVRDCLSDLFDSRRALVLVACSGGPDSLTLAAVLAATARAHDLRAGAVVVDHGWSAEASAAGERAAGQCRELGLEPVELVAVPGRSTGASGGPEAVARAARYTALEEAAQRLGAAAVLLGHTLDDQAETVLLGLGRGSGARSLAGMPARRGRFRRPFLPVRRKVVADAGAALQLHPWHDPANDDPAYTRVRVRRLSGELEKALGAGTAQALARSAQLLREDADALDELAAELLGRSLVENTGPCELWVSPLREALPAIRRRALLAAAQRAGCPGGALTHRHALALDKLVADGRGQVALPGRVTAEVMRPSPGHAGARVCLKRRIVAG
ncbi:tRNA(Ile)-lysidine synthase [Kineosporia sp. NBRC 101677]|uniref:tRNA lysidine(34) synthetase TilS n=1 Tax=Kineosporia sp. NBRC 101677 TaxID=3032197 RepID=UPI0024A0C167|nr:tRNA lysidine(34) synthetase TilS [Kineosporia sp. NBRC 101677]GLY13355.1 tRNA(Ile)-lysidine synthase [Kineosporia sp. NBRC 101677]